MSLAGRALLIATACLLAPYAGPTGAFAALPPAATEDRWLEVRTARFQVYSNAEAPVAVEVARHLERLAEVLRLTTSGLRVDGGRGIRVYVFRDLASFKPYRPYGDDERSGVTAGFHTSGDDLEYIALHAPEQQLSMRFASHEYLHAVLSRSFGDLPVWVNEGLAEFYSTFEARGRRADIGRLVPEHVEWLERHSIPLAGLLLVSRDSPDYQQGETSRTVYAQSWALAHALMMDPADPSRFGRLLAELGRGTTGLDALRRVYGPNAPDSLERRLREYVSLLSLPARSLEFSDDFDEVPVSIRPLDRIETWTALGELLANARKEQAPLAAEHLEAAWSADSTRALSAAVLGAMAVRHGDWPAASRWFAAVQRAGPGEPRALAVAGSAIVQRRLRSREPFRWPASGADADVLWARSMLARALEDRPEATEWLTPYALTFLDDSADVQEGIGALLRAQEDAPQRCDVAGALAILDLRSGNRSAALAMYDRIPRGAERAFWRLSAGDLIMRQTLLEAERLVREDRTAEAESLVVRLRRTVKEPAVTANCDQELAWIRSAPPPSTAPASTPPSSRAAGSASSAGPPAPPPTRAQLDAMAADARNQKRLRAASSLVAGGSPGLACELYDMILGDRPRASLRREVERLKAKYCSGAGRR